MFRLRDLLLVGLLAVTCANKLDRLNETERTHFDALRVWMSDKQVKSYLKLKTTEERDQYLKDIGIWNRFYKYDQRTRDLIVEGRVAVSWTDDMVYMAWGPPLERTRNIDPNIVGRSELMTYQMELTDDGALLVWTEGSKETHTAQELFRFRLLVNNGVVERIDKLPGWDDGN